MSYALPEKTAVLEFEEYPGLEVTVRISPISMATLFVVNAAWAEVVESSSEERLRAYAALFTEHGLIAWTLPEPVDLGGVLAQPIELTLAMAKQWMKAVASVPLPLPRRSSGGEPSEDLTTSPQP